MVWSMPMPSWHFFASTQLPPSVVGEVGSQAEDAAALLHPNMEDVQEAEPKPEPEPASNPVLPDVHMADDAATGDGAR